MTYTFICQRRNVYKKARNYDKAEKTGRGVLSIMSLQNDNRFKATVFQFATFVFVLYSGIPDVYNVFRDDKCLNN